MNPVEHFAALAIFGGPVRMLRAAMTYGGPDFATEVSDRLLAEGWTCKGGTWAQPGQIGMSTTPSPDLFTTPTNAPETTA